MNVRAVYKISNDLYLPYSPYSLFLLVYLHLDFIIASAEYHHRFISGSHGGEYEYDCLLGHYAM
jgi:hypothetical protein